jgi:hypothetical protein
MPTLTFNETTVLIYTSSAGGPMKIQCWGAGGDGNESGAGGSGAAYAESEGAIGNGTYQIIVGESNVDGSPSIFSGSFGEIVHAAGGKKDGTVAHQSGESIGLVVNVGGKGSSDFSEYANRNGTGGGGSGGPSGRGERGSKGGVFEDRLLSSFYYRNSEAAPGGSSPGGGKGGDGAYNQWGAGPQTILSAGDGEVPGGGGGGGYDLVPNTFGRGGKGKVVITFSNPPTGSADTASMIFSVEQELESSIDCYIYSSTDCIAVEQNGVFVEILTGESHTLSVSVDNPTYRVWACASDEDATPDGYLTGFEIDDYPMTSLSFEGIHSNEFSLYLYYVNITTLDVSSVTGLRDLTVENCDQFESLVLGTGITDFDDLRINNCSQFSGEIDLSVLPELDNVELTGITSSLFRIVGTSTTADYLEMNNSPVIPIASASVWFPNLLELYANSCNLTTIPSGALSPLIVELGLEYNNLTSVDLSGLNSITYLYISGNRNLDINSDVVFGDTSSLYALAAGDIGSTSPDFSGFSGLRQLMFGGQGMTSFNIGTRSFMEAILVNPATASIVDFSSVDTINSVAVWPERDVEITGSATIYQMDCYVSTANLTASIQLGQTINEAHIWGAGNNLNVKLDATNCTDVGFINLHGCALSEFIPPISYTGIRQISLNPGYNPVHSTQAVIDSIVDWAYEGLAPVSPGTHTLDLRISDGTPLSPAQETKASELRANGWTIVSNS